ncbi:MAG TPA: adenylyl-sulfate kinase [Byssovorax sp.]
MSSGFVVWFTGLSGSGKSTLAAMLSAELRARGVHVEVHERGERVVERVLEARVDGGVRREQRVDGAGARRGRLFGRGHGGRELHERPWSR